MQTETNYTADTYNADGTQPDTLKTEIITALRRFVRQRPGLDWRNYGSPAGYREESRKISQDLKHAETLLRKVELAHGITGEDLITASRLSFSGRLTINKTPDGITLDYCVGGYFPTEYRKAVASVCAGALWDYVREKSLPPVAYTVAGKRSYKTFDEANTAAQHYLPSIVSIEETYNGLSGGDWLRRYFRREMGRGIASRFFN